MQTRHPYPRWVPVAAGLVCACLFSTDARALSCATAAGEEMRLQLVEVSDKSGPHRPLPPLIDVTNVGSYLALRVRPDELGERPQFLTLARRFRPTEEAADFLESTKDYVYSGCCTLPLAPLHPGRYVFSPEHNAGAAASLAPTVLRVDLAPSRETADLLIDVGMHEVGARYSVAVATFEGLPSLVRNPLLDEISLCPWGAEDGKVLRRNASCAACTYAAPGESPAPELGWQLGILALVTSRRRARRTSR